MKYKLITIEGTDYSGKSTQTNLLLKRLQEHGIMVNSFKFPNYNSATGKIVAGPYLGRSGYGNSYFSEGAVNVDGKVAGLLFAADRLYNLQEIKSQLNNNHLLLDRYVDSNMAHQGGKILNKKERKKTYKWFEKLEYGMLGLPKADVKILIYMPREYVAVLKQSRQEKPDEHEKSEDYLKLAEKAYLEVAKAQKYKIITCVHGGKIRSIEDINNEIFDYVVKKLK